MFMGPMLSGKSKTRLVESGGEFGNQRIQIFDTNNQLVEVLGGPGAVPGQFSEPWSIALDSNGNLYVADALNHRVQKFLRKETEGAK